MRLTIAVDFGTSRSGFAFAYASSAKDIHFFQDWQDAPIPYEKTRTQLLYQPNGDLEAWGWSADRRHAEICQELRAKLAVKGKPTLAERRAREESRTKEIPSLISGFKMMIKEGTRGTAGLYFIDHAQRPRLVVRTVADYLAEMRKVILASLGAGTSLLREDEIRWCLTIPAIWNDADKQLMREAAKLARITTSLDDPRLVFALEPEAAALACKEGQASAGSPLPLGTVFMIVDAGGGTVDLTTHIVDAEGLLEVVQGSGGACGSGYLDRRFQEKLRNVLGSKTYDRLERLEPAQFQELMTTWETFKCNMKAIGPVNLPIKRALEKFLTDEDPIFLNRLAEQQNGEDESIVLTAQEVEEIVNPVFDEIVDLVSKQHASITQQHKSCDYIFLVGGFARSKPLQERIAREFAERVKKVITPINPGRAVLEGAVLYGNDEALIASRCSRLTYGCAWTEEFVEGVDPPEKKHWNTERNRFECRDRFGALVHAGEAVSFNQCVKKQGFVTNKGQSSLVFQFYSTPHNSARWTSDPGMIKVGELAIELNPPAEDLDRGADIELYFGKTEIRAEARDRKTGASAKCTLKFERG
jgi:molecular chaperone DnaK (HSP70)